MCTTGSHSQSKMIGWLARVFSSRGLTACIEKRVQRAPGTFISQLILGRSTSNVSLVFAARFPDGRSMSVIHRPRRPELHHAPGTAFPHQDDSQGFEVFIAFRVLHRTCHDTSESERHEFIERGGNHATEVTIATRLSGMNAIAGAG